MEKQQASPLHKVLTVIGTVLCIILIPILIINCTLIIKSFTSEEVPSVAGKLPLIVLTDSMYPVSRRRCARSTACAYEFQPAGLLAQRSVY